ncbi:antitoxin VbhA family protein [Hoyosella rhizosphaerae]|uniref:Antitoxin VbhA domain-containing protein n=1 Tax=Hoyosella rhizosphaerae TaxID=1755582 RepID=A0A916UGB3_9ACTN|nr:antitoxin VbhA family protein [Hoyosella rhizosphaerae]MBN4925541.1 antitoxin VbhA family protein [Hoyosella rhizosphaerae]GGC69851.1 hypothetical protein GCM10011410_23340 [Hoyosella rhizosphaerae]
MADRISPAEKARRARSVDDAIHSARLEGADVSPETQKDMQEYAEGRITSGDILDRIRRRTAERVQERRGTVA